MQTKYLKPQTFLKRTISLLLTFLIGNLFGQRDFRDGYILKINKDSINGQVSYQMGKKSERVCLFKGTKKSKMEKFSPQEIVAYGFFKDKRFVSREIKMNGETRMIFMEEIVNGSLSLLRYEGTFYLERDSLIELPQSKSIISNTSNGLMSTKSSRYIGILNFILHDCDLNADKIKYDEKQLTYLIQNYNRCKGSTGRVYKAKMPWTKLQVSAFSGLDVSTLSVDDSRNHAYNTSTSGLFGIGLQISSPRLYDRISLTIEPAFTAKIFQRYTEEKAGGINYYYDDVIHVSYVRLPIGLCYYLRDVSHTPFLKLGGSGYFNTQIKYKTIKETEISGQVSTYIDNSDLPTKSQYGLWVSLGYMKSIYGKIKGSIEIRYENTNGFIGYTNVDKSVSSLNNINFIVGVSF